MDIIDNIKNRYLSIDFVYRRAFWILFVFGNLLYLFQSSNYLIGYHSYLLIDDFSYDLTHNGRPTTHWFSLLLLGQWSPYLFIAWSMLFLALGAVCTAKLWAVDHRMRNYVILGAFLIATPHVFSWVYFATLANMAVIAIYPLTFLLALRKSSLCIAISTVLIALALSSYQASFMTPGVLFVGMLLNDVLAPKRDSFSHYVQKYRPILISLALGVAIYGATFITLKYLGVVRSSYMVDLPNESTIIKGVFTTLENSFLQYFIRHDFTKYGYMQLSAFVVIAGFGATLVSIIKEHSKRWALLGLGVALLISLFIAGNAVEFITDSKEVTKAARVLLYGYTFVVLYFIHILLKLRPSWFKNLCCLVMLALIYVSVTSTLMAQRDWKIDADQSNYKLKQLIQTIKQDPAYGDHSDFRIMILGKWESYRQDKTKAYYDEKSYKESPSFSSSNFALISPGHHLRYIDPTFKINRDEPLELVRKRNVLEGELNSNEFITLLRLLNSQYSTRSNFPMHVIYKDIILIINNFDALQSEINYREKNLKALENRK